MVGKGNIWARCEKGLGGNPVDSIQYISQSIGSYRDGACLRLGKRDLTDENGKTFVYLCFLRPFLLLYCLSFSRNVTATTEERDCVDVTLQMNL